MINIIIKNINCEITGLNDINTIEKLDNCMSYYVQGHVFSKAYTNGWFDYKSKKWKRWDGKRHLFVKTKNVYQFPTGLLNKAKVVLKNLDINFIEVDKRDIVSFGKKIKILNKIEHREYQERIHRSCMKNMGGIVKSATGSGKSISILKLVSDTNIKTNVFVTSVDLLYQMKETFEKFLGISVGIIGDGECEVKKINVVSIYTACCALGKKYISIDDEEYVKKETIKKSNMIKIKKSILSSEMNIWDECHMVACETIQVINSNSKSARYVFGFSGTPERQDGADLLVEAVCGETIVEVTATELIDAGYLVKPIIHFMNVPPMNNLPEKYPSIYKEYIVDNDIRNNKIVSAVEKLVESGRKTLVLVKIIRHGEILFEELQKKFVVYFVRGSVRSEERNQIRQDFINGDIDVIIASVVYDQGIDLPNLDALVLAGSGKSSGRALQRLGRVIRQYPGKKDAIVLDFIDNAKYLLKHTASRIDVYRRESGFKIKLPKKSEVFGGKEKGSKKKGAHKVQSKKRNGPMSW